MLTLNKYGKTDLAIWCHSDQAHRSSSLMTDPARDMNQ